MRAQDIPGEKGGPVKRSRTNAAVLWKLGPAVYKDLLTSVLRFGPYPVTNKLGEFQFTVPKLHMQYELWGFVPSFFGTREFRHRVEVKSESVTGIDAVLK